VFITKENLANEWLPASIFLCLLKLLNGGMRILLLICTTAIQCKFLSTKIVNINVSLLDYMPGKRLKWVDFRAEISGFIPVLPFPAGTFKTVFISSGYRYTKKVNS
jgi:hypothetical protein